MGKPSSVTKKQSNNSLNSLKSQTQITMPDKIKNPLSLHKLSVRKKKQYHRTNKNIKKLFSQLRKSSTSSASLNSSVVCLDSTDDLQSTVISNVESPINSKRKLSLDHNDNKRMKSNEDSLIIINDDLPTHLKNSGTCTPDKSVAQHIDCSTPIVKKDSQTLQDLIVDNFNNNEEKLKEDMINLTKEINKDSFLTIDLTTETDANKTETTKTTVIDLDNTENDCTFVSISNASLSMSGDSNVTVVRNNRVNKSKTNEMLKFAKGISKLNASEKGKLLDLIAKNIFNGCDVVSSKGFTFAKESVTKATETKEDTYIKEVILGVKASRNSIGSNIYHPQQDIKNRTGLRIIVIDGSNVAMEHGKGRVFSVEALKICIDYFLKRGHVVKAFVPRFRCKFGKSSDPRLLDHLERQGLVVYTPSREIQGRTVTPYDDRYIVQCAAEFDGVIVSGDNYRDLLQENPRWRFVIENRLLPFTWVNDMIMFPRDPLGRYGPSLEQFLKHPN